MLKNYIMLLRVRIRELLSTVLLEAPPNVNTSNQEKWEANEGAKKISGGHGSPGPPVETPLSISWGGTLSVCTGTQNQSLKGHQGNETHKNGQNQPNNVAFCNNRWLCSTNARRLYTLMIFLKKQIGVHNRSNSILIRGMRFSIM